MKMEKINFGNKGDANAKPLNNSNINQLQNNIENAINAVSSDAFKIAVIKTTLTLEANVTVYPVVDYSTIDGTISYSCLSAIVSGVNNAVIEKLIPCNFGNVNYVQQYIVKANTATPVDIFTIVFYK